MNRDDIMRMAQEASIETCSGDGWPDERLFQKLRQFAHLVAAAERAECLSILSEMERRKWSLLRDGYQTPWPSLLEARMAIQERGNK